MSGQGKGLKIAMLTYRGNMFCGGQGVYVAALAGALMRRGHRVKVFSGPPFPVLPEGVEFSAVPNENYVNRTARELPANPLSVLRPLEFFEYAAARAGANPEMLAMSLRSFMRLRDLMRSDPPDVVHDNQGLGYGLLLIRALGPPVVATIHHPLQVDRGEDIRQLGGFLAKARRAIYYPLFMQGITARRISRVVSVSAFSADLISRAYRLDRSRVEVVHNGVDTNLFRPLAGIARESGRLLFVGSTEDKKKGVLYLLTALRELPERFHLIIVDGRRYKGRVYAEDLVRDLGLGKRVTFRDRITNEELVEEYNRAEMMVMPSLFEGFGLPALEAFATGTPLIAARAGALIEVVGDAGLLIELRSAAAIREAVLALDGDPARRERMSALGKKRAVEKFSWDEAAKRMEEIYRSAMNGQG